MTKRREREREKESEEAGLCNKKKLTYSVINQSLQWLGEGCRKPVLGV